MNVHELASLAVIAAAQARVAGMQAENQKRAALGQSPAYDEGWFFAEAHQLDNLSIELRNQPT